MKAIVLAAGYATRLYPLTRSQPKALLEVGGRPLLSRLVDQIAALPELSGIVVVSNAKFAPAFERWAESYWSRVPLRILDDGTVDEAGRLGATGDLALALRDDDPARDGEDRLVCAGDNLLELDLLAPYQSFLESRAPTLIVRRTPQEAGASRYNEVELDAEGVVVAFREKPPRPRTGLAAIACYFYPPAIRDWVEAYLATGGNPDAPGHFVAWLVQHTSVHAVPLEGRWFDIGDAATLAEARAFFAAEGSPV